MAKELTRSKLSLEIMKNVGCSRKKAYDTVNILLNIMKETIGNGEELLIKDFGKFKVVDKNERKGVNPATDEAMLIKSRRVASFKCSGNLRRKINHETV